MHSDSKYIYSPLLGTDIEKMPEAGVGVSEGGTNGNVSLSVSSSIPSSSDW